jgi:ABC-type dipeptide/oligopeptide/nickel transport system permease component
MSGAFLLQRALHSAIVLFGTLTLVFFLVRFVPADPVRIMAGPDASLKEIQATRVALGFDKPIYVQYAIYLRNVAKGDLGRSLRHHRPAAVLVMERFPATLQLALASMLLAVGVAIPAGIFAAVKRGTLYDTVTVASSLLGQSVPTFWLGIVLIMVFAVRLRWLPTSGYGGWQHMLLPTITLGLYMMALITRMNRSSMLEVLGADYLRTARAKGLWERVVLLRHALRNALIPVVTVIGLQTGTLLGGAVITETVFAWPGIGSLAVDSITTLDYPVVQAVVILSGGVFVVINFLLDVVYVWLDPRIKYA